MRIRKGRPRLLHGRVAAQREPELEEEQLVEDQRPMGKRGRRRERLEVGRGGRRMHVAQGPRRLDESLPARDVVRDGVRHTIAGQSERPLDDPPHDAHGHRGRLLVDRHDRRHPVGVVVGSQERHIGVNQPRRAHPQTGLDPPVHDETLPLAKPLREVLDLVEPHQHGAPCAVAQHHLEHLPPAAARESLPRARHRADRGHLVTRPQRRQGCPCAPVLVAKREMPQHVLHRREPEARQLGGALRPDPADALDRQPEDTKGSLDVPRLRSCVRPACLGGFAEHGQQGMCAPEEILPALGRCSPQPPDDLVQLGERVTQPGDLISACTPEPLGQGIERQPDPCRVREIGRRQVLERRRQRRQQLQQRLATGAHPALIAATGNAPGAAGPAPGRGQSSRCPRPRRPPPRSW
jgi:hypothetical protein